MNIRFTPETYQALLALANEQGCSIAALVARIVEHAVV